jgi:hypothetical protein
MNRLGSHCHLGSAVTEISTQSPSANAWTNPARVMEMLYAASDGVGCQLRRPRWRRS